MYVKVKRFTYTAGSSLDCSLTAAFFIIFFLSFSQKTVYGLSGVPLQQKQPYKSKREGVITSHRPLERTRSEPPPYSHPPLVLSTSHPSHIQHHLSQQYQKSVQDKFKQSTQLTKVRLTATIEDVGTFENSVRFFHDNLMHWKQVKKTLNRNWNLIGIQPLPWALKMSIDCADSVRGHVSGWGWFRNPFRTRVSVQLRIWFAVWGKLPEETKDNQLRLRLRHRVHNLLTGELNWTSAVCQSGKMYRRFFQFKKKTTTTTLFTFYKDFCFCYKMLFSLASQCSVYF